jgi:type VI secretion system secreted protein VgrG
MASSFFKVYVAGNEVSLELLDSVDVHQALNQHTHCSVSIRQLADERYDVEGSLGASFVITATDEDGNEATVFTGFVAEASLEYEISGSYHTQLVGFSKSYTMSVRSGERYWLKQQLSAIALALASENGISASVTASSDVQRNYVQWGESDWDFLKRIADDNQSWIRITDDGIEIRDNFASGRSIEFRGLAGDGLLGFRVDGRLRPQTMRGTHYDHKTMKSQSLSGIKKAPGFFGGGAGSMVGAAQRASASLYPDGYVDVDARSPEISDYQSLLERESLRSISGCVSCWGTSRTEALRPGETVDIEGGLDSAGTYGILQVSHHWDPTNGYSNGFTGTPSQDWMEPHPPEVKRFGGLIHARVTDNNDTANLGRLKIRYDWLDESSGTSATAWARFTSPHAGANRGLMFLPEVGDEVLVGFEHGDPERPYVIGCVWNGVDSAPREDIWGGDMATNDVKRIVTKSGHRIQFSDKPGSEAIIVATPSKLKLSLLEKADETGRPMMLLHAAEGDILISAPNGRIHFHSATFSRETGGQ